jgi:alpha-glucoside transport system substrate-binding protein
MPMPRRSGGRSAGLRGLAAATSLLSIMVLTGCLQNPNQTGGEGGGVAGTGFVDGGTPDGDKVVSILGAFGGPEQEAFEAR